MGVVLGDTDSRELEVDGLKVALPVGTNELELVWGRVNEEVPKEREAVGVGGDSEPEVDNTADIEWVEGALSDRDFDSDGEGRSDWDWDS
jgi:hypothetical protein